MKEETTYLPNLSIGSNYSAIYFRRYRTVDDSLIEIPANRNERSDLNLTANREKRTISRQSRKKIINAIGWLFQFTDTRRVTINDKSFNFRLGFVTLTLPSVQRHTDNKIKKTCLNNFLNRIRNEHNVHHYVWRAEKQKNGNIHFHLLIDQPIHFAIIQRMWNQSTELLGYVSEFQKQQQNKYRNGFYVDYKIMQKYGTSAEKQKKRWLKGVKEKWRNPHSTEIKNLKSIKNIGAYVTKYMAKSEKIDETDTNEKLKVSGNIWNCSEGLNMRIHAEAVNIPEYISQFKKETHEFFTIIYAPANAYMNTELRELITQHFFRCNPQYERVTKPK